MNLGPNYGYLGIVNDAAELSFLQDYTGLTTQIVTGMKKTVGTTSANVATEVVKAFDGPDLNFIVTPQNWYSTYPDTASDMCISIYSQVSGALIKGKWNDISCSNSSGLSFALVEYGGMPGGATFTSSQTVSANVDATAPSVSSVTNAPSGTSRLGSTANPLVLTLNFDDGFRGLATSDFTITGAGNTGCVVSAVGAASVTTSPFSTTVTVTGCTASGAITITLAANSINDMSGSTGNAGPTAAYTVASFTRDITAPTITAISKTITGTSVA
jgi:hypothetical protein